MEASMHGFGTERAADAGRVSAHRAAMDHSAVRETETKGGARRGVACRDGSPGVARIEHTLFALVLGCLGYVWLGALLAEAAQAL